MITAERRRTPRMKVNGLAYVNLGPDNGGVILDISEGGLCFQSSAPVKRTETIRFWFSYRGQRLETTGGIDRIETSGVSRLIEVRSELAWTDQTLKRGGLRFTNLSATAREQIRDWIRQPALIHVNQGPAGLFPSVKQSGTNLARVASARIEGLVRWVQSARMWKGYSGGVVTGVVVSALLLGVALLATHTHVLGDSLIQLGERLGGRSWSQTGSAAVDPAEARDKYAPAEEAVDSFDAKMVRPDLERGPATRVPKEEPRPEIQTSKVQLFASDKPAQSKPEVASGASSSTKAGARVLSAPRVTRLASREGNSEMERIVAPMISAPVLSGFETSAVRAAAPETPGVNANAFHVEASTVGGTSLGPEKFLEVGKFKERLLADGAIGHLTRLGFPASVVQRSRFFSKSYQVLVGPYGSDPEAEAVHKDLAAKGFTPRSYERGKRDFTLPKGLQVSGKPLPVGFCVISWESYAPDAIVRFDNNTDTNVTLQGRWVKQSSKFPQDAVAYLKNGDGTRTLVEIRFGGMAQALVFSPGRN